MTDSVSDIELLVANKFNSVMKQQRRRVYFLNLSRELIRRKSLWK